MADRENFWVYVHAVNDDSRPISFTGSFTRHLGARPRTWGQFKLCKDLNRQEVECLKQALSAREGIEDPVKLDMIPQQHGAAHTIMGFATQRQHWPLRL